MEAMVCWCLDVAMAVGRWSLAEGNDGGWLWSMLRWPMAVGRWPKEKRRSVAGHFPWPVTYLRRLNPTNEKIVDPKKPFLHKKRDPGQLLNHTTCMLILFLN